MKWFLMNCFYSARYLKMKIAQPLALQMWNQRPVFFLSRFWVSKWHPKILQWHPKSWKPWYGFALCWSETIWGKYVFLHGAIATDGCNVIGRHNFLAQKLEAKIVSLVSVHCHAHRCASACYYTAADLYSMVYEAAKALYCNYGSVLLFHRCDRLAWRCIRLQWRKRAALAARMQSKLVDEWGNNYESSEWDFGYLGRTEAAVRK